MEINDEESHILRAAFRADVTQIVRVIAQRHRASGAALTWQLVRDVREEALADIGLASRWPISMIEQLAAASPVPPSDGQLTAADVDGLRDLAAPIREIYLESDDPSGGTPGSQAAR